MEKKGDLRARALLRHWNSSYFHSQGTGVCSIHLGVHTVPHDVPFRRALSGGADAAFSSVCFQSSAADKFAVVRHWN